MELQISLCQNALVEFAVCKLLISQLKNIQKVGFFLALSLSFACATSAPVQAQKERTMTFPADRSYGTIINLGRGWSLTAKRPKGNLVAEAQGTVKYSADDALMLTARFPLTDNPEVMYKLPVDAFQFINFINLPAEDKIFTPLTHMTGLRRLDFEEGEFEDKAFEKLSKLVNLEAITVRECFVTGESLTHFGSLKKLRVLVLRKVALDWKLLNEKSPVFASMRMLQLTDVNLADDGLNWLKKMPNLTRLVLDGNTHVTDKGLLIVKQLKNLKRLELKKMKLSPQGIMQLKGSSIHALLIEDANYSDADRKRIFDALPNVRVEYTRRPLKEGTMEIFAPLH